ncbi:MAG: hypothetical protein GF387_00445 [Candidatus Portnoybacteria bacterium]|nr:hypothetical protein [Candidatus Portnoybacteria bacterium]
MTNPKIQEYIEQCKKQGMSKGDIRYSLISKGWPKEEIDNALKSQSEEMPPPPKPEENTIKKEVARPKGNSKKTLIISLIILIILGGSFASYAFYFKNLIAKKAILDSFQNLEEIKTFDYFIEADINAELSEEMMMMLQSQSKEQKINIIIDGEADFILKEDHRLQADISASLESEEAIGAEIIYAYDKIYFKIKKLSIIPMFSAESMGSEWIQINLEEANSTIQGEELSEEEIKELTPPKEMIDIDNISSEEINEEDCYYAKLKINPEEAERYFTKLNKYISEKTKEQGFIKEEEMQEFKKSLTKEGSMEIEVWVDKSEKIIRQAKINLKPEKEDLSAKIRIEISEVNEIVQIEKPENTITLEEIMGSFMNFAF